MKKALMYGGGIAVGLIAIIFVVGLALPREYSVTRSVEIDAPAEFAYADLVDFRTWNEWTAWTAERDPECEWTYAGPDKAVGSTMEWDGPELRWGRTELTAATPHSRVEYDLWFAPEAPPGHGVFELAERGGKTTVTWNDSGDLGAFPPMHIMGIFIEGMLEKDFDEGLANLKQRAERSAATADAAVAEAEVAP